MHRALRLVPFNPDDYALAETLVKDNQSVIADAKGVGSALSLYFQWPEQSMAFLVKPQGGVYPCRFSFDEDEREPSELRVHFDDEGLTQSLQGFETLTLRFEVFRTCYEFATEVLAVAADAKEEGWSLIVAPPERLLLYKNRRLPRVVCDADAQERLPEFSFRREDGTLSRLRVLEIGLRSLKVASENPLICERGSLVFGQASIAAQVLRIDRNEAILSLHFEAGSELGQLFNAYRLVAYPSLRPKEGFDDAAIARLYEETNYFGKFATVEAKDARLQAIEQTWHRIRAGAHETTADYLTVDANEQPTGASSAVLAFFRDGLPVWAFHQLCAKAKPELLEETGQLYLWRAEYLAARPEALEVVGWFDSRSRWLERIYVKFTHHKEQLGPGQRLYPVQVARVPFKPASAAKVPLRHMPIGEAPRACLETTNALGGVGPRYLNASGIFDAVVALAGPSDAVGVCGEALAAASGGECTLEVTVPTGTELGAAAEPVTDVDRFFVLAKSDLVDFLASVMHAIAVTRRKMQGRNAHAV